MSKQYAILMKPQYNIAFEEEYHRLCVAELTLVLKGIGVQATEINIVQAHKGHMMTFSCECILSDEAKETVFKLSFFYMLLENNGPNTNIVPIGYEPVFPEDLSTRLKYSGKTNETITRLMLNIGLSVMDRLDGREQVSILDPMCGKGTTLFEAMTDGYDAYGIDENKGAIHDMSVYFSRYLKEGHYKHQMEKGKAIVGGKNVGETLSFKVAKDKEAAKRKEFIEMKCIAADAAKGCVVFKKNSIDVIACDLPYGIAHIGKKGKQSTRSIVGILDGALDSWDRLLKKGGSIALAWNTFTDSKQEIVDCLGRHGFVECPETEHVDFSHRVSQAINRDLVFALKK